MCEMSHFFHACGRLKLMRCSPMFLDAFTRVTTFLVHSTIYKALFT
jgi:hypothetical protein